MAYINQEKKRELKAAVDAAVKLFGLKGKLKYTMAVRDHSTLVLNIKSGPIDFISNFNRIAEERDRSQPEHLRGYRANGSIDVNPYWFHTHFDGQALEVLKAVFTAMNIGNWDKSDPQSDYFNVGWYVDINIGRWDKPYEFVG